MIRNEKEIYKMNDYSFNKGLLIIIENFTKGLSLILPLFFDGIIKQSMYFILILFISKGFYDLYKEYAKAPLLILLPVPLSGAFTGFCVGLLGMTMYYSLIFEFEELLLHLIFASLIVLPGGVFLAYRLTIYKDKLSNN